MVSHSGLITVMTRAARKAAPRLRRDFGEVEQLQVSRKGPADFVSMADKRAEQTLFEELKKARPDWGFLLEEGGEIPGCAGMQTLFVQNVLLDCCYFALHAAPLCARPSTLQRMRL